jgi:RNA polymerase sigma-70 factor (ECF subfamily)
MAASKNEQLLLLADALLELPVDQREVVILKHLRNRPLQQIADETGRTTASVAGLLRRGLAQLRQILERTDDP